jgi:hypothetical protein
LCYKCGENFVPGHECTAPATTQLSVISASEMGDGGGILVDDMLEALETSTSHSEPDCHISLYAISGAPDC